MDWESGKRKLNGYLTKYRYFMMILLAGIAILLLPTKQEEAPVLPAAAETQADFQKQLEDILKEISGVGKVRLLLTEEWLPCVIFPIVYIFYTMSIFTCF